MQVQIRYPSHGPSSIVASNIQEPILQDVLYQNSVIEALAESEFWDPWMRINVLIGCLSGLGWEVGKIEIPNDVNDLITVTFDSTRA